MEFFFETPLYHGYALALGLIIGSFLNVFLYRFHTGRSLNGSSHCLSCQKPLRWFDLIPVVSYVVLRGRCRQCGSWVPVRYALVETLVGLAFLAASYLPLPITLQIVAALFCTMLVAVAVYDMYHTIIPDEFSLTLTALAVVYAVLLEPFDISRVLMALLGGVAAAGPFLFLWAVSQGRWIGLGDSKLAFPLGVWVGLSATVSLILLSFWIGAVLSMFLLGVQHYLRRGKIDLRLFGRPLTMKSEIPFAPFLIIAFVLVEFFNVNAISFISYVLW